MLFKASMVTAALVMVPVAARAQAAAPAPAPALDPKAEASARELVGLMHMDQMLEQGMAQSLGAMRSGVMLDRMLSANPQFAAAKAKNPAGWSAAMQRLGVKQAAATEQMTVSMKPEVTSLAIRSYATHYTPAELQGLLAFYRSPLGAKTIAVMPQIMADTMAWVQQQLPTRMAGMAQTLGPDIQTELKPLLDSAAK